MTDTLLSQSSVGAASATTIVANVTAPASGGTFTVFVSWGSSGGTKTLSSVVSNVSGTFSPQANVPDNTDNQGTAVSVLGNVAAGAHTITATFSASATDRALAVIWSDVAANPIDGTAGQLVTSAATDGLTSGNATNTRQPARIIACILDILGNGTVPPAAGTGFTDLGPGWDFAAGINLARFEVKRITTTSAVAATATAGSGATTDPHVALMVILDEAPINVGGRQNPVIAQVPGRFSAVSIPIFGAGILAASVALNAYTLTAAQGSFVETGEAATLTATRLLSTSSASFAETGEAANIRAARVLVASSASFAETGDPASLVASRRLTSAAGSFALAGEAASLPVSMPAATGTFTETGEAANLRAARVLSASTGSFSETGSTAGLNAGWILSASTGSFVETGEAAAERATRLLPASSGSLACTGDPATLAVGVPCGTGSFALTGTGATLGVSMPCGVGSFALTGTDSARNASGSNTLLASTGTFSLTGDAAGMVRAAVLSAAEGAFALSGQATAFRVVVPCAGGLLTLTGEAAAPRASRYLGIATGAFTLTGSSSTASSGSTLPAGAGVLSLTGSALAFLSTRAISAAHGTFSLLGEPANLRPSFDDFVAAPPARRSPVANRQSFRRSLPPVKK